MNQIMSENIILDRYNLLKGQSLVIYLLSKSHCETSIQSRGGNLIDGPLMPIHSTT